MDAFIYCLIDPTTKEIRYVGKTNNLKNRLNSHLNDDSKNWKSRWISSLRKNGLNPQMEVLESFFDCDDGDWQEAERWWISYLRFLGCRLCNLDGGGKSGFEKSESSKQKIRAARANQKNCKWLHLLKYAKLPKSEQAVMNMSKAQKGKTFTKESREKMRLAKLGKKQTPEAIEAAHAPLRGQKRSEETKRKMSEAKRAGWARRKALGLVQPMPQELRELHRKNSTGRKHTEEAKAKMRAAIAARVR